ncbi:MAG: M15 family metallopeptidase [Mesorhizobium sp.]
MAGLSRVRLIQALAQRWGSKPVTDGHPVKAIRRLVPPDPPPVDVVDYRTALRAIASPEFCKSEKYQEQQWRAVRTGCHPKILEFERLLIRKMRDLNVPMFCHCAMRSPEDQNSAYVRGVSRAKAGESAHNWGCAVDVIHSVRAWNLDRKSWEVIGHVGKELADRNGFEIVWGGDFKSLWDPAHWELAYWREIAHGRLKAD